MIIGRQQIRDLKAWSAHTDSTSPQPAAPEQADKVTLSGGALDARGELKLVSDREILSHGTTYKEHLRQRKQYFNIGGPWKKCEEKLPTESGKIYYRVMTLDKAGLNNVVRNGFESKRTDWDGQNVSGEPGISYGIGNADFSGDKENTLAVVFQLDGDRLPWDKLDRPGRPRPTYGAKFHGDIAPEAIHKVWAYDLKSESLHLLGERKPV